MTDQTYQIGEKEYSVDELQKLIEKGSYALEMEQKYNTDFPNAWSAYGKGQNRIKELEQENEQLKSKATQPPEVQSNTTFDIDQELPKRGYVRKEELADLVDQSVSQREQVNSIVQRFKALEKEIDGSDGRPKFETQAVFEKMQVMNTTDPEEAYKALHLDQLAEWKANKLTEKPGFAPTNTSPSNSDKLPTPVKITRDNLGQAIQESLREGGGKI